MGNNSRGPSQSGEIDIAIGIAVRQARAQRKFSAKQLAGLADISAAMISRIENGLVSPSISTLCTLANALDVPLVTFFGQTSKNRTDFTFVRSGEGLKSTGILDGHSHDFVNLAIHTRRDLIFEARRVTLVRQDAQPPSYVGIGVVFIEAIEGEAIYRYGDNEFTMRPGDALSLDAELSHGFIKVITPEFSFFTAQAEPR